MNPPTEQLIRDYLNRVSLAARGKLGFTDRQSLLDRTRTRIEAECGGVNNASATQVRKVLASLGDPIALVEREQAKMSAGQARQAGASSETGELLVARVNGTNGINGAKGTNGVNGAVPAPVNGAAVANGSVSMRVLAGASPKSGNEVSAHEAGAAFDADAQRAAGSGPSHSASAALDAGAAPAPELLAAPEPRGEIEPDPAPGAEPGSQPTSGTTGSVRQLRPAGQTSSRPSTRPSSQTSTRSGPRQRAPSDGHRLVGATKASAGLVGRAVTTAIEIARRNPLELMAVLVLGIGGAVYPPIWLVGVLLALVSKKWSVNDKLLGVVLPIVVVIIGTVLTLVFGGQHATISGYAFEAWLGAERLSRVAMFLGAAYLFWALRRGRRQPKLPPWNVPPRIG
jgi:hypothetical protein